MGRCPQEPDPTYIEFNSPYRSHEDDSPLFRESKVVSALERPNSCPRWGSATRRRIPIEIPRSERRNLKDEKLVELYETYLQGERDRFRERLQKNECPRIPRGVLRMCGVIGESHGKRTYLAVSRATETTYAVRVYSKVKNPPVKFKNLVQEKKILFAMNCNYVVQVFGTVQGYNGLGLVREHSMYGSLRNFANGKPLPEEVVKFFAAQIVMGIEYLHACDIVHRNLTSDNTLVFEDYHLKIGNLTDCFVSGSAGAGNSVKFLWAQPPEVLRCEVPYGAAIDWWALGVIIFENRFGEHPFGLKPASTELRAARASVLSRSLNFPGVIGTRFSPICQLLLRLLEKNRTLRLGSSKKGAREVKEHPWFEGFSFAELIRGIPTRPKKLEIPPPLELKVVNFDFWPYDPEEDPDHVEDY